MDQIRSAIERLQELSGEELDQLLESIVTEFESVDSQELSPQVVDSMTELAAALDSVKAEKSRREEELAELSRLRDEAAAKVRGNVEETVAEDVTAETDSVTEAATEATPAEEESDASTELATEGVAETELATAEAVVETPEPVAEETTPETELATAVAEPEVEDVVEEAPTEDATTEEAEAVAEVAEEEVAAEASADEVTEDADAGAEATLEEENPGKDPATVTAAADQGPDVQAPADRRPKAKTSATVAITAGADIPGVTAGSDLPNMRAIAEAMTKRMHTMRNVHGGDGEQHTVATLVASYPEDRVLRNGDLAGNQEKIESVTSPQAITAAGGFCAPVEVTYDILGFGVTDRPVKNALASFQADRGGIQWTKAPILGDIPTTTGTTANNAISLWTKEDDAAALAGTPTKPCFHVTCGTTSEAYLDAIPLCLTYGNLMTRAYPELVEANNNLAMVTFARYAETRLLTRIGALSTQVSAVGALGAARDFFNQVDRAAVAYRQRHRMNPNESLRVIAPTWIKNLMRADLVMEMPGNGNDGNFALADSKIESWFAVRHINVSWTIDGEAGQVFGAQANGALLDYPGTVVWYLFAEGTFLFLDGGTLDLGLVRDSSLNAVNDYKMFVETFEAVAMRGIEALRVESTIAANGTASALTAV